MVPAAAQPLDSHIERLLDVERRVEARLKDAEAQGRARVEAARAEAALDGARDRAEFEARVLEERTAEAKAQALALKSIEAEAAEQVRVLNAASQTLVDRLAAEAVQHAIGGPP